MRAIGGDGKMRKNEFDVSHKLSFHLQPQHKEELKTNLKPHLRDKQELETVTDKIERACNVYMNWKKKRVNPWGLLTDERMLKAEVDKFNGVIEHIEGLFPMSKELPIPVPYPRESLDLNGVIDGTKEALNVRDALGELISFLVKKRSLLEDHRLWEKDYLFLKRGRPRDERKRGLIAVIMGILDAHVQKPTRGLLDTVVAIVLEAVGDKSKARDHRRSIKETIKDLQAEPEAKKVVKIT
jgi:hypothetical protein